MNQHGSLFHCVYGDVRQADKFYAFLQNIFHLVPQDRFHALIKQAVAEHQADQEIYAAIQHGLPEITPFHAMLTYALPSLRAQKAEIGAQTRRLIPQGATLNGYIEIGTTGRYVKALQSRLKLAGPVTLIHDKAPGMSPVDIVERGKLGAIGAHVFLDDYAPLPAALADASVDLVSCFVGLHHMAPGKLKPFLASIARVLRPGGYFIVRDHDVKSDAMHAFVSLAHAVFNAGLGETWASNAAELRHFASVDQWIERIEEVGLAHTGERLLQSGDPSDNVLMAFHKQARAG